MKTTTSRQLLIIASHWPPIGGVPAYRGVKMAKVLLEAGWTLTVLTAGKLPESHVIDESLAGDAACIPTIRVPVSSLRRFLGNNRLGRLVEIPDPFVGWIRPLLSIGRKLLRQSSFRAILTTAPPYSLLAVGARLAAEAAIPWICDIRDLGADNPFYVDKHWIRRTIESWWERRYLPCASWMTTATVGIGEYLVARGVSSDRLLFLPSGYDEDDFFGLSPSLSRDSLPVVSHVGALHGYRDIAPIVSGLAQVTPPLRFRQLGFASGRARACLEEASLGIMAGRIDFLPHRPFRSAIAEIMASDLLLVVETRPNPPGGIIQQKLFPYLRAHAPILAVSPSNEMTRLIEETSRGLSVWPPEPDRIAAVVERLLASNSPFRMAGTVRPSVAQYEVRRSLSPLVRLLETYMEHR